MVNRDCRSGAGSPSCQHAYQQCPGYYPTYHRNPPKRQRYSTTPYFTSSTTDFGFVDITSTPFFTSSTTTPFISTTTTPFYTSTTTEPYTTTSLPTTTFAHQVSVIHPFVVYIN